jgi:hypothetical protein
VNAIKSVKPLLRADTTILATEHQIGAIIDSFPEFFIPEKKTLVKDSLYEWRGDMNINFNMPGLSDIAWGNAQALEVLHLVDFETAYMLFSLYKFQDYLKAEANSNMELIRSLFKTSKEEGGIFKIIFNDYYRQIQILASLEKNMLQAYEGNLENLEESVLIRMKWNSQNYRLSRNFPHFRVQGAGRPKDFVIHGHSFSIPHPPIRARLCAL